jgi:hypothetical protein
MGYWISKLLGRKMMPSPPWRKGDYDSGPIDIDVFYEPKGDGVVLLFSSGGWISFSKENLNTINSYLDQKGK